MAKKPPSDRLNRFIFTASMGDGLNMLLVVLLCVAAAVFYKFVWQSLLACFLLALLIMLVNYYFNLWRMQRSPKYKRAAYKSYKAWLKND